MRILKTLIVLLALASPVFSQKSDSCCSEKQMIGFYLEGLRETNQERGKEKPVCRVYETYQKMLWLEGYIKLDDPSKRLENIGIKLESVKILQAYFAKQVALDLVDRIKKNKPLNCTCGTRLFLSLHDKGLFASSDIQMYEMVDLLSYVTRNHDISGSDGSIDFVTFIKDYREPLVKKIKGAKSACEQDMVSGKNWKEKSPECDTFAKAIRIDSLRSEFIFSEEMFNKILEIRLYK